ncbi:MAG: ABC transporter permease [Gemmatimonadaceae bacterium]
MENLLQDVRFALRTLSKAKAFTAVAVMCLALGIGVNTMIFSVVNTILLRPMPFEDPEGIVVLHTSHPKFAPRRASVPYPDFQDWQREARSFSAVVATTRRSLTLADGEEPERLEGAPISWNAFPMLGVKPLVGRVFREDEDRPGAPGALILGHEVWKRRYASDPGVIGRSIMVNGKAHTIVGVMPERFKFPFAAEAWVPLAPVANDGKRGSRDLEVWARLKPGVTLGQARLELAAIAKRLAEQYPETNREWSAGGRPVREYYTPEDVQLVVLTMMGAVTFVLLIACANVANLMLSRATSRHREIAVRAALGAGRWRVVRQLLTESVIVALLAGGLGVLVSVWGLDLLQRAMPKEDPIPFMFVFEPDRAMLAYTLLISVVTGVVFGLAPALQATKGDLLEALKEGSRGAGAGGVRSRMRASLVVAEVALSLVLLVGAALFVRSFLNLQRTEVGFDTRPLMTLRFYMPGDAYDTPAERSRRVADVVRRVEALPGVQAAFASNHIPLGGGGSGGRAIVDGVPVADEKEAPRFFWTGVAGHYFRTMALPILHGRDLTDAEVADSAPVAVINEAMAKKMWAKPTAAAALGGRFRIADDSAGPWFTVVGIVKDTKQFDVDQREPEPSAFMPYPWLSTLNTGLVLRVASGDPASVTTAVRRELRAADAALPIFDVRTMEQVRELGYWQFQLFGWMFSIFGGLALFLASIGVYGVLAYSVAQRTHEIGVRLALGATRRDVLGLVVGHGMRLAGLGILIGVVGSAGINRVVKSLLFNVGPWDPVSFLLISGFLVAVAFLASYLPARRAMAVDPIQALRYE